MAARKALGMIDWVFFAAYIAFFADVAVSGVRSPWWYIGLGLSAACAGLWVIARLQLGDSFSVGPEARRLVTRGLYSKVRHPIYVFGTMAFMFVVLALLGWRAVVVWALVLTIQIVRAGREERILAAKFGEEYSAYRSTTWF